MKELDSWIDPQSLRQLAEDLLTPSKVEEIIPFIPPKEPMIAKASPAYRSSKVSLSPVFAERIKILADWLKLHFYPSYLLLLNSEKKIFYENEEDQEMYFKVINLLEIADINRTRSVPIAPLRELQVISQASDRGEVTLALVTSRSLPEEHLQIIRNVLTQATTIE